MSWTLDHLVVAAPTLADGVRWCEQTLGVTPGPGGTHPLMGTHNRLLRIATPAFPRAYFEIIAIDPQAPAPGRPRWFDLDTLALPAPRLVHWVARCDDLAGELATLRRIGIDRGEAIVATRGALRWRIAVRSDGARLFDGALPTLIEWGDEHPADAMADGGVRLESLSVGGLPEAVAESLPPAVVRRVEPGLAAVLQTPRGRIVLESLP